MYPGKRKAEDAEPATTKKAKHEPAAAVNGTDETSKGGSKTIFVGRLSWNVDNDWLATEFADCGEVVSARVQMDRNSGKSRGFAYVTFATAEAAEAAVKLNGKEIDGRAVNIDHSEDKDPSTTRERRASAFGDKASEPSSVLFAGNLSFDASEDSLWEVFAEYGDIKSVRLPTDRDSGRPKGFGYIEFADQASAKKAFEALNGQEIVGRAVRLDYSQPRDNNGGGRGGFGGGGGGGFGGRGGGRGGRVSHFQSELRCSSANQYSLCRADEVDAEASTGDVEVSIEDVVVVEVAEEVEGVLSVTAVSRISREPK